MSILLSSLVTLGQPNSLEGRSSIELNIGLWHESKAVNDVIISGTSSTAKSNGFLGGLAYSQWLDENLNVTVSVGLLSAEAESRAIVSFPIAGFTRLTQRTSSVIPILVGVRYYLPQSEGSTSVRPFAALGIGPFLGFEAKNTVLVQESRSETAFGVRLGGGVDFLLSQSFKLGANIGYYLMTDYSTPVGARKNYNGPEFSLGFAFIFGDGSR